MANAAGANGAVEVAIDARFWWAHFSARRAALSHRDMRISGAITTVHKEYIYHELAAAA